MFIEITIRAAGQEVNLICEDVVGTPTEREERTHALARRVTALRAQTINRRWHQFWELLVLNC